MCSVVQEFIANLTSWRGRHLRNGIKAMLNDPTMTGLAQRLYRHPRIATLTFCGKLPSYIPSTTFARALADIVLEDNNFRPVIDGPLAPFIKDAGGAVDKLESEFTKWFDDSMDGFGGWYKRNVQLVLFLLGLGLAAAFNVSSLEIARALWTQPVIRDAVVQSASDFYKGGDPTQITNPQEDRITKLQTQLDGLNLPIGWDQAMLACLFGKSSRATPENPPTTEATKAPATPHGTASCRQPQGPTNGVNLWWEWLALIAGWLVTALATTLGTQFWFQTLGNALALRAAGPKPPKASGDSNRIGTEG